ncbi:MAG: tRNA preQ1(34) S-adenosylmethionine ribosyltransferase-isomerase QueA [Planctomycetota bacterium]|nr:tRNA preQ1(34) S-adenosylmethionine ribosyltransferase-isomerase QueA [Planctomycetota bacterium]
MRTTDFDFELPQERIAQEPANPRDAARLFVRDPSAGELLQHAKVCDLPDFLRAGDLLVVNDTRVLPARVLGRRATGGQVELLFLQPDEDFADERGWRAMVRPAKKLKPGERVECRAGVVARMLERSSVDGTWAVTLEGANGEERAVEEWLALCGAMPLPPYIQRSAREDDAERYQTVYASRPGAVAAPTAGLHFTGDLLKRLRERGVEIAQVTLHVGAGTFLPVTADRLEDHAMHSERFELSSECEHAVRKARATGGRVIAVGTTSARVLESCRSDDGSGVPAVVRAGRGDTRIFLRPGHGPTVCDGLFTNFHLPKSTLVMLVSSFIGTAETLAMYRAAVEAEYRFYSYGDATLLLR